jgi:hypothetical protein
MAHSKRNLLAKTRNTLKLKYNSSKYFCHTLCEVNMTSFTKAAYNNINGRTMLFLFKLSLCMHSKE